MDDSLRDLKLTEKEMIELIENTKLKGEDKLAYQSYVKLAFGSLDSKEVNDLYNW
jgi:hypothetical protein